jgi:hypothetical protein
MLIEINIDADTERYLRAAAAEHGTNLKWLAEAAVSEAALTYAKNRDLVDWTAPKGLPGKPDPVPVDMPTLAALPDLDALRFLLVGDGIDVLSVRREHSGKISVAYRYEGHNDRIVTTDLEVDVLAEHIRGWVAQR